MNHLQEILTIIARYKASQLAVKVLKNYLERGRCPDRNDYPPVVVSCAQTPKNIYTSEKKWIEAQQIHETLLNELENKLGPVGSFTRYAENSRVGHCAEPNAANKLLRRERVQTLDDIYFGKAYRPRTGVVIPPCGNCRIVFNNVVQ